MLCGRRILVKLKGNFYRIITTPSIGLWAQVKKVQVIKIRTQIGVADIAQKLEENRLA